MTHFPCLNWRCLYTEKVQYTLDGVSELSSMNGCLFSLFHADLILNLSGTGNFFYDYVCKSLDVIVRIILDRILIQYNFSNGWLLNKGNEVILLS